jgi:class 3 adenylate cyclase
MEALADGDPEEARSLLDPVLALMMEAVHHLRGHREPGDGRRHHGAVRGTDHPRGSRCPCVLRRALRMREAFERFADGARRSTVVPLQMRVGLNSGEVVVRSIGSDLRMDYSAVGRTTHLAARMEQLATPGSILIAPATLALAEGFIRVQARGPTAVKGLASPIEAYELSRGDHGPFAVPGDGDPRPHALRRSRGRSGRARARAGAGGSGRGAGRRADGRAGRRQVAARCGSSPALRAEHRLARGPGDRDVVRDDPPSSCPWRACCAPISRWSHPTTRRRFATRSPAACSRSGKRTPMCCRPCSRCSTCRCMRRAGRVASHANGERSPSTP